MSKLATNWDALITSVPANKQAASDAAARGTSFEPARKIWESQERHAEAPFKTKAAPKDFDLTGLKCGRLTVIGLADIPERSRKGPAGALANAFDNFASRLDSIA